jgi:hypothetical protein
MPPPPYTPRCHRHQPHPRATLPLASTPSAVSHHRPRSRPRPRHTVPDFFSDLVTPYRLHEVRDPPTFSAVVSGIKIRQSFRPCTQGRPAGSISPAGSLEARCAWWYSSSRLEHIEATSGVLSSVRSTSSVRLIANPSLVSPGYSLISSASSPPAWANHRRATLTTPMSKPWLGLYDISRKQLSITNSLAQFLLYISFAWRTRDLYVDSSKEREVWIAGLCRQSWSLNNDDTRLLETRYVMWPRVKNVVTFKLFFVWHKNYFCANWFLFS